MRDLVMGLTAEQDDVHTRVEGLWWAMDRSGPPESGILQMAEGVLTLDVHGSLPEDAAAIHGRTDRGDVTLIGCSLDPVWDGGSDEDGQRWLVGVAFLGTMSETVGVTRARIALEHLSDFALVSSAMTGMFAADLGDAVVRLDRAWGELEAPSVRPEPAFVVVPRSPVPLDGFLDRFVAPLQDLLLTAGAHSAEMERLVIEFRTAPSGRTDAPGLAIAEALLPAWFIGPKVPMRQEALLFHLMDLIDAFEDRMIKWFTADLRLRPSVGLFSNAPSGGPALAFLLSVHALEIYHEDRRMWEETDGAGLTGAQRTLERLAVVFADAQNGSRPSEGEGRQFRERIVDLARDLSFPLVATGADVHAYAARVTQMRDLLLTYHWPRLTRTVDLAELSELTGRARLLLQGLLLSELGLGDQEIAGILSRAQPQW